MCQSACLCPDRHRSRTGPPCRRHPPGNPSSAGWDSMWRAQSEVGKIPQFRASNTNEKKTHLQPIMGTLCNLVGGVLLQGLHHEALARVCPTHTHIHFNTLKYTVWDVWKGNEQIIYKIRNDFFFPLSHTHTEYIIIHWREEKQICFSVARHAHTLGTRKLNFITQCVAGRSHIYTTTWWQNRWGGRAAVREAPTIILWRQHRWSQTGWQIQRNPTHTKGSETYRNSKKKNN